MAYPSFAVGDVLAASDMNAVGLWRVTNCTVTSSGGTAATASNGVITIGAGNTSVTVNSAFSADYANYLITFQYCLATTGDPGLLLKLGSVNLYYGATVYYAYDASGDGVTKRNADPDWNIGYVGANNYSAQVRLFAPQLAVRTSMTCNFAGDLYYGTSSGMLANTTQYTSFNLTTSSSSLAGGTVRVYGYRN